MQSNSVCYHTRDKQTGLTLRCRPTWVISLMITDRIGLHLVPLPLLRSAVCSNGKPTSTDFGKKWDGKNGKCKSYGQLEKPVWLRSLCSCYTETENCSVGNKVSWQLSIEGTRDRSRARRNFSIVSSVCLTVIISWPLFHRRVHSTPFTNI